MRHDSIIYTQRKKRTCTLPVFPIHSIFAHSHYHETPTMRFCFAEQMLIVCYFSRCIIDRIKIREFFRRSQSMLQMHIPLEFHFFANISS